MNNNQLKVIRARWIIPVYEPPIENGAITMAGDEIVEVDRYQAGTPCRDLGDVAVLPGLVNAHTHLEFSDLTQPVGTPGNSIAEWIPQVLRQRGQQQSSDQDRVSAIAAGLEASAQAGVALIGEIATRPWPITETLARLAAHSQPLPAMRAFFEVLGLTQVRQEELLAWSAEQMEQPHDEKVSIGLSPHAPYTCPFDLMDQCVQRGRRANFPVAMHLAETREERQLLERGDGPLAELFRQMQLPGLDQFPSPQTMGDYIRRLAEAKHALLIHGNYLNADEIGLIASLGDRVTVVVCPRTHAYFGHDPHPVDRLVAAGVNVALGTDSLASNPDLNLWSEAKHLMRHRQDLAPSTVVRMATLGGARALGVPGYGRIARGHTAKFFVLRTTAENETCLWHSLAEADTVAVELV